MIIFCGKSKCRLVFFRSKYAKGKSWSANLVGKWGAEREGGRIVLGGRVLIHDSLILGNGGLTSLTHSLRCGVGFKSPQASSQRGGGGGG